jgi:hypothetical protein
VSGKSGLLRATSPSRRAVDIDCQLTVAGVAYEVDAELAGETVVVWWGLFDQELWVARDEERFGPYHPVGGPIPWHRYRKHRKKQVRGDALPISPQDDYVTVRWTQAYSTRFRFSGIHRPEDRRKP